MQMNIHFTMTDVQQQSGLMFAYMHVQQIEDYADINLPCLFFL